MSRLKADSYEGDIAKLKAQLSYWAGLNGKKSKRRIREIYEDIANLEHYIVKPEEITALKALRKEIEEFHLLKDLGDWHKREALK